MKKTSLKTTKFRKPNSKQIALLAMKQLILAQPLLIIVFTNLVTGCAQPTQAEIKMLETREMRCTYDDAYKAAANGLFSLGFSVTHSDKDSGILTGTRTDPNTGNKVAAALAFGIIGLLATDDRNEAVTFMLSELEPELTQLRMKLLINGKSVIDRKLMTQVWQRIEREAMLDYTPERKKPASQAGTPPKQDVEEASATTSEMKSS